MKRKLRRRSTSIWSEGVFTVRRLFCSAYRGASLRHVLLWAIAAGLSGCSILPVNGPQTIEVVARADEVTEVPSDFKYELVELNPEAAEIVTRHNRLVFSPSIRSNQPPREIVIGEGDVVSVTIFESSAGGLFIPLDAGSRAGNFVTVPPQTVDRQGNVKVPYAGAVRATGRTPARVQEEIEKKLSGRAIEPQAVVSVTEQRSNLISVLGEVNNPNRLPPIASGERLLDVIARAGGPKGNGENLWVRLVRNGERHTVHFSKLVNEPSNNIYVQPNDTVYLFIDPPVYLALGATSTQGRVNFEVDKFSLADGVAKAGGLLDDRADPRAVFLYREESRELAAELGINVAKYDGSRRIPVIYKLDLRNPKGMFAARRMQMRNRDVLYIANAGAIEIVKALSFIRTGIASIREAHAMGVELD